MSAATIKSFAVAGTIIASTLMGLISAWRGVVIADIVSIMGR